MTEEGETNGGNGNGAFLELKPAGEIVRSLDAAREKVGKAMFGKDPLVAEALEQAKFIVVRHLEWDASREQLVDMVRSVQSQSVAIRTQVDAVHRDLKQRSEDLAQREAAATAHENDLAGRIGRVVALEKREEVVGVKEKELSAKEAHLQSVERAVQAILQRNLELNNRFDAFNDELVQRLKAAEQLQKELDSREATLSIREKKVEQWKLDLADREAQHAAKVKELHDLEMEKARLQEEMGAIREQRLAEVERIRVEIKGREESVSKREVESSALARALSERNIKLVERKQQLDEYEKRLNAREKELDQLRGRLNEREAAIRDLEKQVKVLDERRKELLQSHAKIRGEI